MWHALLYFNIFTVNIQKILIKQKHKMLQIIIVIFLKVSLPFIIVRISILRCTVKQNVIAFIELLFTIP